MVIEVEASSSEIGTELRLILNINSLDLTVPMNEANEFKIMRFVVPVSKLRQDSLLRMIISDISSDALFRIRRVELFLERAAA